MKNKIKIRHLGFHVNIHFIKVIKLLFQLDPYLLISAIMIWTFIVLILYALEIRQERFQFKNAKTTMKLKKKNY